jgi:hypothetical protein
LMMTMICVIRFDQANLELFVFAALYISTFATFKKLSYNAR